MLRSFALLLLAGAPIFSRAASVPLEGKGTNVAGVARGYYAGWENSLMMRGGDCKLIVAPAIGGRAMHWSVNGENILYEDRATFGRTLSNTPAGFFPGGAKCDIGPELRGIPRHQDLWLGPWLGRVPRENVIHVISPPDMSVGIQIDEEFTLDADTGELGVIQRMRNIITNDTSFCLWDHTLCKNGGYALIPLTRKSQFKAGWSMRRGPSGKYSYDGNRPSDERARVIDNVLVVQARGLPESNHLKVGADSIDGWIAYVRARVLFIKYFPVFPKLNYTDGGNTVEFYCDDKVAELEPLAPEIRLQPAEEYQFPEKWVLIDLPKEVASFEQARALVKKIPKSPFR